MINQGSTSILTNLVGKIQINFEADPYSGVEEVNIVFKNFKTDDRHRVNARVALTH